MSEYIRLTGQRLDCQPRAQGFDLILDAQEMLLLDQGFPAVFKPELPAL